MSGLYERAKSLLKLNLSALGLMHLSNRYINSVSSGKNLLKPGIGKYFRWKYGEVFYQKAGVGSPVVLLHDLDPASSSYEWTEIFDTLCESHTVYALDLPGCGRSSKQNTTYTNYYYVLFLTSFIKEVVKKKCSVLATGYSSSFAIMASSMDDSLIGAITAVNPKNIKELMRATTRKSSAAAVLLSLPVIGTSIYNMLESRENISLSFTEKFLFNPFRSKQRFVDAYYESAHFNDGKGKYLLSSIKGRYMAVNLSPALSKLKSKMVILYGDKEERGAAIAAGYQKHNESVKALAISDTKYLPQMERPHEFLTVYKASRKL